MALSPILRRAFPEADRAAVQELAAAAVEADPDAFLKRYADHPESIGGRYVCDDLFKELFEPYAAGREGRGRYNAAVHNAAAVLSALQFERTLTGSGDAGIFLTGMPGAGKTSTVLDAGRLPSNIRFVFEGQLSRPETGMAKMAAALAHGVQPEIVAVLALPETALANTFTRFRDIGRGASVALMAEIGGDLADGLEQVRARFGSDIKLTVRDVRDKNRAERYTGWDALSLLREEGTREQIEQRLRRELERARASGSIDDDAYAQALGRTPFTRYRGMAGPGRRGLSAESNGPGLPGGSVQADFVGAQASAVQGQAEAGEREIESTGARPVEQRWSDALAAMVAAKQAQADRLIDRLEGMIEAQEVRVSQAQATQPGVFALPGRRQQAARALSDAQQTLSILNARLERVREIRNEPDAENPRSVSALARAALEREEPELAAALTATRAAKVMRDIAERREQRKERQARGQCYGPPD